jgi:hypothetical protein
MVSQGFQVQDNVLFQDNKSAILLEKNGKALSSKHKKHVNIWYFFITNRIDKGNISLVWCPTGDMIGDFMTKTPTRCSVPEVQRPNLASSSCTGSRTRKSQNKA